MFSGIVESVQELISLEQGSQATRIWVRRPAEFSDLRIGDSISTNGICLTLESMDMDKLQFALGAETLKVLKGLQPLVPGVKLNLERSLQFGDRIHGHLVTGHVDSMGEVSRSEGSPDSWFLDVKVDKSLKSYIWRKGSLTINGVSLTINQVSESSSYIQIEVCLIPETLKRTNLQALKVGDWVTIEPDYFTKMLAHMVSEQLSGAVVNAVQNVERGTL